MLHGRIYPQFSLMVECLSYKSCKSPLYFFSYVHNNHKHILIQVGVLLYHNKFYEMNFSISHNKSQDYDHSDFHQNISYNQYQGDCSFL